MFERGKLGFIDPVTVQCCKLISYHDMAIVVVVGVITLVRFFLFRFLFGPKFYSGYTCPHIYSNNMVEFIWTVVPGIILCVLAYHSWLNLYCMEAGTKVDNFLKVIAHQ